jgi:hypothetical protein
MPNVKLFWHISRFKQVSAILAFWLISAFRYLTVLALYDEFQLLALGQINFSRQPYLLYNTFVNIFMFNANVVELFMKSK